MGQSKKNTPVCSPFSWITPFVELFFPFKSPCLHPRLLSLPFPQNARHSADHCAQPERRQVRTQPGKRQAQHFSPQSIPHPPNTQKMSTLGEAFLPCHPPIYPSTHPSNPLIRPGFQEHRTETDDPVTSSQPSPPCAPSFSPTEPFSDLSNAYVNVHCPASDNFKR